MGCACIPTDFAGDYQKAGVMAGLTSNNHAMAFDEDF